MAVAVATVDGWCAGQSGATMDHPFGEHANVHRVGEKIFALVNTGEQPFVNLKADPTDVTALLEQFSWVRPGYHMSKRHWVTVDLHLDVDEELLEDLLDDSYHLVRSSLTKKLQAKLA